VSYTIHAVAQNGRTSVASALPVLLLPVSPGIESINGILGQHYVKSVLCGYQNVVNNYGKHKAVILTMVLYSQINWQVDHSRYSAAHGMQ
jgi:hypothetical protein